MRNHERLATLIRNVFAVTYDYQFPIWQKKDLDKAINSEYIYSPSVIKQGLDWYTSFNSAIFYIIIILLKKHSKSALVQS